VVDGNAAVGRVLDDDLVGLRDGVWRLRLGGQLAFDGLLCERQSGEKNDQQYQQDVDERRQIHLHMKARSVSLCHRVLHDVRHRRKEKTAAPLSRSGRLSPFNFEF
jgi:hypothetical protein